MQAFLGPNRRNRWLSVIVALVWIGFCWSILSPIGHGESGTHSPDSDQGPWPMAVLGLIMVGTYIAIAFELLHKSLAAMAGACLAVIAAVIFGLYGEEGYEQVHTTIGHDLGVLGVLLGTSILVEIAGHSGLFHFISVKIVKKTEGESKRLFAWMAILTVVFCTFLTIAPGTLIMVTLALAVTRELKLDPKPYIIMIALVANSGALMTFASGICTMMIGSKANLAYLDFFRVTTPIAIITAFVAFLVVRTVYKSSLIDTSAPKERREKVDAFDEWALVHDRRIFWRSAVILLLTTIGFATAQTMHIGLDLVAMTGGVAALLFSGFDTEKAIKKVKWPLVVFFIGLFVIIGAVQESGLLVKLAGGIEALSGGSGTAMMLIMAVFVLVLSGIVDNIPVAATLIPITIAMGQNGADVTPLWWTLVICSNLGGNSTPVGSVSSVIALHALEQDRSIKIGWGEFLKIGGLTLFCQGVVALTYLFTFLKLDLFPRG